MDIRITKMQEHISNMGLETFCEEMYNCKQSITQNKKWLGESSLCGYVGGQKAGVTATIRHRQRDVQSDKYRDG